MHMKKFLLIFSAIFCLMITVVAQNRTISGRVTDATGQPLQGASVLVKGTKIGTTTNSDGNFIISIPSSAKALEVSSVDLVTQEVAIRGSTLYVTLISGAASNLQEVVVVGYGTQQKKAFTGSASKIDAKEFSNLMTASVDKQLAGRATGVQVTNSGGLVNRPATIRVRGIQSISQSNDPLIVVDGVPIVSGNLAIATNSNTLGDINPADIESIDVLKDGSATAIYGSRAAGGVILITTKKGIKGRSRVTYDGFIGFSSPQKKFDLLNAKEFVVIANEKLTNAGLPVRAGVNASVDTADTDWQGAVFIKNAISQNHNVSVQGGSDKTAFYFSLNYSDQKGIIVSNYNKAYRVRMNIDHDINEFIKVGNNLSVSRQEDGDQNNGSNSLGGSIAATLRLLPNVSPYNSKTLSGYNINYPSSNGLDKGPNSTSVDDNFSNVAYTLRANKYYSDKYRIIDNLFVELSPLKGLKFRTQAGIDMLNDYSLQSQNIFHGDSYGKGEVYNANRNYLRLLWQNYLNYNKSIGNHNFYFTLGNEVQKTTTKALAADGQNISDPFFIGPNLITNSAFTKDIEGTYLVTGFQSYFGRLNYDYKNKYFLQATLRRDGQSALAPGNKYGTFPGFSAGWRISEEGFWQHTPALANLFNEIKLKASYAKVGNTLTGFPYLTTFGNSPYGNLNGLAPTGVGNAALIWETSSKYDIGIEFGILKNRFNLTLDWFLNDVDNLVLNVPQPLSAGLIGSFDLNGGIIPQNIGQLENRGVEISLGGNIINKNDLRWDFNVNYTDVHNKIKSLFPVGGVPVTVIDRGNYNRIEVGQPMDVIFGYVNAGVNSANGNPMWLKADGSLVQLSLANNTTNNKYYVANSKSDGSLGAVSSLAVADKRILGQTTPTYFGAFTNTLGYKGFGLEVMFRYSGGNKLMNYTAQENLFNMSFQNNGSEILNRWTTPGQETDIPKLYYGLGNSINSTSNSTSRFVEKGDYIRLQNVVLSFTVSEKTLARTNNYIRSAKIFVQGQNLHVWTKYKGADPDNYFGTQGTGVDASVSPQVRTISAGVSLGF